jgi:hypothetical protein
MTTMCEAPTCNAKSTTQLKIQPRDTGSHRAKMLVCSFHKELVCAWRGIYRAREREGKNFEAAINARDQMMAYISDECAWKAAFKAVRERLAGFVLHVQNYTFRGIPGGCDYLNCGLMAITLMPGWRHSPSAAQLAFCFHHARIMSELYYCYKVAEAELNVENLTCEIGNGNAFEEGQKLASIIADRWKFNFQLKAHRRNETYYRKLMDHLILLYSSRINFLLYHGSQVPICCARCQYQMREIGSQSFDI